ncbi:MAG: kinase/pyrophosphorylase [Rickettsiales bacterium]|nr:kinase/pyrophosphorylase [Rickettsiales bacterium]
MKRFHLHLVSDSTGETVSSVSRAALAQFEEVSAQEHVWSLIRTKGQLEKVLSAIDQNPGVVMFTLVNKELRSFLRAECQKRQVPCIPVLGPIIRELSGYLNEEAQNRPGVQHEFTEDYFNRVEAINFALAHDDGQGHWDLDDADIVVIGVSRTSKSPTCVYLANRGFKAANIPFVHNIPLPEGVEDLKKPLIVGLTIGIERLLQIRKTRLLSLNQEEETNYIDMEEVKKEIEASKRVYRENGWPVIDVTRRSVEETAAMIIQLRQKQLQKREDDKAAS